VVKKNYHTRSHAAANRTALLRLQCTTAVHHVLLPDVFLPLILIDIHTALPSSTTINPTVTTTNTTNTTATTVPSRPASRTVVST